MQDQQTAATPRLLKSTSIVASMTMLSRLMGFARDIIFASIFGATGAFDAFVVAFKIPNFMRRLFGEGAFSQAFVPVLAQYKESGEFYKTRDFINHIAGTLGLILLIMVGVVELITPMIITIFAPGFVDDPHRFLLASHLLHLTFPYIFFIGLTAFAGAILNTYNQFAVAAFAPVLLNVVFIAAAWWWAPHAKEPVMVLGWATFIAGIVQLAVMLPFLKRLNLLPRPVASFKDAGVRRVLKLMVPALFGVSVAQLSLLIDNFFASFLPQGSISWLYYSDRLTYLPLGVIGVALATVVLPHLSKQHAKQSELQFSRTLDWAIRLNLVIGLPAAIGLFMLAIPLIATLIGHGKFNDYDTLMTSRSLMAFAVGLPGFMLIKVLASGFYSRQNIKTPVKIAAVAMLLNLVLNILLIKPLAHAGLALATSLASAFNAGCLGVLLIRSNVYQPDVSWRRILPRIIIAGIVSAIFLWWGRGTLHQWLVWSLLERIWHLFILIVGALIVYFGSLYLLGLRYRDFRATGTSI